MIMLAELNSRPKESSGGFMPRQEHLSKTRRK